MSRHQLLHGLQNHTQLEEGTEEMPQVSDYPFFKVIRDAPLDLLPALSAGVQHY